LGPFVPLAGLQTAPEPLSAKSTGLLFDRTGRAIKATIGLPVAVVVHTVALVGRSFGTCFKAELFELACLVVHAGNRVRCRAAAPLALLANVNAFAAGGLAWFLQLVG